MDRPCDSLVLYNFSQFNKMSSTRNSEREQAAMSFLSKVASGLDIPKVSTPIQEIFYSPTVLPNRQPTLTSIKSPMSERDQAAIGFLSTLHTTTESVQVPPLNQNMSFLATTSFSEDDIRQSENTRKSTNARISFIDTLKDQDDMLTCYTWRSGPVSLFSLIPLKPSKKKYKQSNGKQTTPFISPYLYKLVDLGKNLGWLLQLTILVGKRLPIRMHNCWSSKVF